MDNNENMNIGPEITKVVIGLNQGKYQQTRNVYESIDTFLVFYKNIPAEFIDISTLEGQEYTETVQKVFNSFRQANLPNEKIKPYYTIDARYKKEYEKFEKSKDNNSFGKGAVTGVLGTLATVIAIGGIAAGVHEIKERLDAKKETTETTLDNTDEVTEGYGFYKYDLSGFEDMDEYNLKIGDSEQKQNALNYLNILKTFNNEITLVDGKTQQIGGLTIEQLVAVDAYANSNIYEAEDYIKNFGLYDFTGINDDFQQAVLATGAYLAEPSVDGTILADIFKDEAVRANYLKQLEYRNKILNAETKKEQNALAKEYVEFLSECSINQASDEYLDYDQHPGMAFATSVIVNALNYHNIILDKEVVSEIVIIGTEEDQSKLNSICADADSKLESAAQLVTTLKTALVQNETNILFNTREVEQAKKEDREPVLLSLQYEELDALIRETLCDQEQINELINKTLEKEEKLVTTEDQRVILANAVNIQIELLNSGKGGYYKDEKTAELASQLQKVGDTATTTQQNVQFSTPADVSKIENAAPEQTEKAKDELNQKEGLLDNTDSSAEEEIKDKVEEAEQEGVNYYNAVVSYYEAHGDVAGIPAELQAAYNNLGAATYNLAKQTGVARYMTKEENKYTGGETTTQQSVETESQPTETKVEEVPVEQSTIQESPVVEDNTSVVPETTQTTSTTTGGEVYIDPAYAGIATNISTSPVSEEASISTMSLEEDTEVFTNNLNAAIESTVNMTDEEFMSYIESGSLSETESNVELTKTR